jgi:hypothetical protein
VCFATVRGGILQKQKQNCSFAFATWLGMALAINLFNRQKGVSSKLDR